MDENKKALLTIGVCTLSKRQLRTLISEIYLMEVSGLDDAVTALPRIQKLIGNTIKGNLLKENKDDEYK